MFGGGPAGAVVAVLRDAGAVYQCLARIVKTLPRPEDDAQGAEKYNSL